MKLSLIVQTAGKMAGKAIPITVKQFLVGRDPQCHLRPASPMVSKRHCLINIANGVVTVRDFNSTNGTFVNEDKVSDEHSLKDGDILKIGPLEFKIAMEIPQAAKVAVGAGVGEQADDDAAAMLLGSPDTAGSPTAAFDSSQEIPTGSTVMEVFDRQNLLPQDSQAPGATPTKEQTAKANAANTSTAAKAILDKYMRRTRG